VDSTPTKLEARLEWAKGKLQNVKYVYKKLKRREAQLDERREALDEETQALEQQRNETEQKRQAVEAEKEKLMRVIARLQGAMENELQILTDLRSGDPSVFDPDGTGRSEASSSEAEGTDSEENEKSTEELINSLFPKRLGASGPGAASGAGAEAADETSEDDDSGKGAAAQQFDKIKQDIQGEEATRSASPNASPAGGKAEGSDPEATEEDDVATEEVSRIMGVFEDLDS
jgi:DNA repair exonuclease SbcCD ATPase subunit